MTLEEFYKEYSDWLYEHNEISMEYQKDRERIYIKLDDDVDNAEITIYSDCIIGWARERPLSIHVNLKDAAPKLVELYNLMKQTIIATRLAILEK